MTRTPDGKRKGKMVRIDQTRAYKDALRFIARMKRGRKAFDGPGLIPAASRSDGSRELPLSADVYPGNSYRCPSASCVSINAAVELSAPIPVGTINSETTNGDVVETPSALTALPNKSA